MKKEVVHRCPKTCPWNKKCFVCKTQGAVTEEVVVLYKCPMTKKDIPVNIATTQKCG